MKKRKISPSILRLGARTPPDWTLSSYNRVGGRTHPIVERRRNRILDMWAAWATSEEIATALEISEDTVRAYLRRARRRGDPRAQRPVRDRVSLRSMIRRRQATDLFAAGMTTSDIAKRMGVHVRAVQYYIKGVREDA